MSFHTYPHNIIISCLIHSNEHDEEEWVVLNDLMDDINDDVWRDHTPTKTRIREAVFDLVGGKKEPEISDDAKIRNIYRANVSHKWSFETQVTSLASFADAIKEWKPDNSELTERATQVAEQVLGDIQKNMGSHQASVCDPAINSDLIKIFKHFKIACLRLSRSLSLSLSLLHRKPRTTESIIYI